MSQQEFENPQNLTNQEILHCVTSAFSPLRCVAEIWDYDQKLKFKVFDERRSETGTLLKNITYYLWL